MNHLSLLDPKLLLLKMLMLEKHSFEMDTEKASAIRWQTAPKSLRAPTTSSSVKEPKWDLSSEICKLKDRNSELYEETPQIERDYAASLRKLIRNYTPKKNAKDQETTQKTEFR